MANKTGATSTSTALAAAKKHSKKLVFTPAEGEVPNAGGGYGFAIDNWKLLDRFLILGSDSNKYYSKGEDTAFKHAVAVERCVKLNGTRTVDRIVEVSAQGRSPNNDYAIFALALATTHGDDKTRSYAYKKLWEVVRTGTHMLHFASFTKAMEHSGRGVRNAISRWYVQRNLDQLAYQLLKYQSRDGWAQSDVLRLAHPGYKKHAAFADPKTRGEGKYAEGFTKAHSQVFKWAVDGEVPENADKNFPKLIIGFEAAKTETDPKKIVKLITDYKLTREMIPTESLKHKEVWEALLQNMPLTAMVRNLGKMTSVGLIEKDSNAAKTVSTRLNDEAYLRKSKVHPIQILSALGVYKQGRGDKGSLSWTPVAEVSSALDEAFYKSFINAPVTGKSYFVAVDCSGSMSGATVSGLPGMSAIQGAITMAMVILFAEKDVLIRGYSSGQGSRFSSTSSDMIELGISRKMHVDTATRKALAINWGGTDCSLPYRHAIKNHLDVDVFINITDSETNQNSVSPATALKQYREKRNANAKQVVIAMSGGDFSIADPNDPGSMDMVGFDSACPALLANFASDGRAQSDFVAEE
jgi:60 kDa SS-A/Ro ribonucleoprotein